MLTFLLIAEEQVALRFSISASFYFMFNRNGSSQLLCNCLPCCIRKSAPLNYCSVLHSLDIGMAIAWHFSMKEDRSAIGEITVMTTSFLFVKWG